MQPGGTTEIIWHFAGYFHLAQELSLPRPLYELGGSVQVSADYSLRSTAAAPARPDAESGAGAYSPAPLLPDRQPIDFHGAFKPLKFASDHHSSHAAPHLALPPTPPIPLVGAGGGGGFVWPDITIEYVHGSAQRMVYVEQIKFMVDNDKLLVTGGTDPGDLHGIDVAHTLSSMLETALAQVPADLDLPLQNQNATAEFIHDRDMAHAEAGPPVPASIQPGLWVNGELQPTGTSHPVLPVVREHSFDVPSSDGTVAGLAGTVGSNVQQNLAQIADLNEAAQTLVVLGNYFQTNAIVQTNVWHDSNNVTYAGPTGQTVFPSNVNQVNNIAEFAKKEVIDGGAFKAFAGPAWHVDICSGDFLDVKTLVQQNWMMDNDVIVQTTSGAYARALTGGNTQIGLGSYFDLKHYDVISVRGDYHGANVIFQKNILLDDDVVKAVAALGPGHDQFLQQISWNGNTLLNDAKISNLGTQDNLPVSDEMLDLVNLLGKGETAHLDSSFGWMFSGNGTGRLDVLYVTGDYYDINVVTQINVLSDVDTAIQYLPDVTPPRDGQRMSGDALQQSVSAGGNTQINSAKIIDVGTLVDQHIGGQYYSDTILIQANFIAGNNDKVIAGDTTTLVPELIAFTGDNGQNPQHDPHHEIAPVKDILAQSDLMGSVVH